MPSGGAESNDPFRACRISQFFRGYMLFSDNKSPATSKTSLVVGLPRYALAAVTEVGVDIDDLGSSEQLRNPHICARIESQ